MIDEYDVGEALAHALGLLAVGGVDHFTMSSSAISFGFILRPLIIFVYFSGFRPNLRSESSL